MTTKNEKMGALNEFSVLFLFENNDIILTKRKYKYDRIDFYYETADRFYEIELKSRTTTLNYYKTTIFAKNKVQYYIDNKTNGVYDKTPAFYIIFGFPTIPNGNDYDYYYIQYKKSTFKDFGTFQHRKEQNKEYYEIPIELLKPIDGLITILKESKESKESTYMP